MTESALKLAQIGNSQGVRLPKGMLRRYGWAHRIVTEERPDGLLLKRARRGKFSWDETFKAMAASGEHWGEWESTAADGLEA